jgi:hypothetical protein
MREMMAAAAGFGTITEVEAGIRDWAFAHPPDAKRLRELSQSCPCTNGHKDRKLPAKS